MTPVPRFSVFIPGAPRNPLNGSWGHWAKHHRWATTWRDRTAQYLFVLRTSGQLRGPGYGASYDMRRPKRITLCAQVGRRMDNQDNLRAALKPIVDGLVDARVIHSDGPTSGHVIEYLQLVNRRERGVRVTVAEEPIGGAECTTRS